MHSTKPVGHGHTGLCDLAKGFATGAVMNVDQVHGVFQCFDFLLSFADLDVQIIALALKLLFLLSRLWGGKHQLNI